MFDADILEKQLRNPSNGAARRKALLSRAEERVERDLKRHCDAHRESAAAMLELFKQRSRLRALTATYGRSRQAGEAFVAETDVGLETEDPMIVIDGHTEFETVMEGLVKKTPLAYEGPFTIAEPIAMSVEEALALSHVDRAYLVPGYVALAMLAQVQWMDHSILDGAVRRAAAHGIIGETLADDLCGCVIEARVITEEAACKRFAELRQAHRESLRASMKSERGTAG